MDSLSLTTIPSVTWDQVGGLEEPKEELSSSVNGPELLNMYVGQSEENVRQVFARAKF